MDGQTKFEKSIKKEKIRSIEKRLNIVEKEINRRNRKRKLLDNYHLLCQLSNPVDIYCRLVDIGFPKKISKFICQKYEKSVYKGIDLFKRAIANVLYN